MEVTHLIANQGHTHHKITNSAKIEAMHAIKLQVQQNENYTFSKYTYYY